MASTRLSSRILHDSTISASLTGTIGDVGFSIRIDYPPRNRPTPGRPGSTSRSLSAREWWSKDPGKSASSPSSLRQCMHPKVSTHSMISTGSDRSSRPSFDQGMERSGWPGIPMEPYFPQTSSSVTQNKRTAGALRVVPSGSCMARCFFNSPRSSSLSNRVRSRLS